MITGAALLGGFGAVIAHTNTLAFCTSCHEMGNCPGGRTGPTTGGRLTLQRNSSVAAGSMRIADQL